MNIKQIRLSKNMTQKQLADAIGVDHTIISKYEKGQTVPSVSRLEMIAKALGVNVDMILNDEAIEAIPATTRRRAKVVSIDDDKHYISESSLAKKLIAYYKGTCELCGKEAPFKSTDGQPFLEAHYVKWLSKGGAPTIDNLVVLCPNCHRKVHELHDAEDIQKLQEAARRHVIDKIL